MIFIKQFKNVITIYKYKTYISSKKMIYEICEHGKRRPYCREYCGKRFRLTSEETEKRCGSLEDIALKKALEFKKFLEERGRKPVKILQSKERREIASEEQKEEHNLAQWLQTMKHAKKGRGTRALYSFVEKILIETLGEDWYDGREGEAIKRALDFKRFFEEKGRKPALVLSNKTKEKRENATEEQKGEHILASWFSEIKRAKKGKSTQVLHPSVEKILIELLGEKWYDDREEIALNRALEFKDFFEREWRKQSKILQTKKRREEATEEQKREHSLAQWIQTMKHSKIGKGWGILYPSVEEILIETLGEDWYENERART